MSDLIKISELTTKEPESSDFSVISDANGIAYKTLNTSKDNRNKTESSLGFLKTPVNFDWTNVIPEDDNTKYDNYIFEIGYDYDLVGQSITLPSNLTLKFNGGKFSNGTLTGNKTKIDAKIQHIFNSDVSFTGSWSVDFVIPQWFGALADGINDDHAAIQSAFDFNTSFIKFPLGTYRIARWIVPRSNTTIIQVGTILIDSDILATENAGAIIFLNSNNINWFGGKIDASGATTYNNNIIIVDTCTDCEIKDVQIIDSPNQRYPLSPIRSLDNTRVSYNNITIKDVADTGFMTNGDSYCSYVGVRSYGGSHTAIETTSGNFNTFTNCVCDCILNTSFSAFSFNDTNSVAMGNITIGGAFGITVGHVGRPSDNSVVSNNVINNPVTYGINVQATKYATISNNTIKDTLTGLFSDSSSMFNVVSQNTVTNCTTGFRLGKYYNVVGNIAESCQDGYRNAVDGGVQLFLGNMALNGSGVGFRFNIASSQKNNIMIGNFAGDNQGVPTQTIGFASLSSENVLFGNVTDGNHTIAEKSGTFTETPFKDLSEAIEKITPITDKSTGGTGSAGAGNQYISINIDGTSYKVLHDGTI